MASRLVLAGVAIKHEGLKQLQFQHYS